MLVCWPQKYPTSSGFEVCSIIKYHSSISHSTKICRFSPRICALAHLKIFLNKFFLLFSSPNVQRPQNDFFSFSKFEIYWNSKIHFFCKSSSRWVPENAKNRNLFLFFIRVFGDFEGDEGRWPVEFSMKIKFHLSSFFQQSKVHQNRISFYHRNRKF